MPATVPYTAALVPGDDLHEGVGHAVEGAHARGRGDGRVDRARGPDPEGLQPGRRAALEGHAESLARRAGVELRGERIEAVVARRRRRCRQARVVAGLAGGTRRGTRRGPGARGDVAQRLVGRRVGFRRAGVALVDAQQRDREVVDLRGLRGARDREAREVRRSADHASGRAARADQQANQDRRHIDCAEPDPPTRRCCAARSIAAPRPRRIRAPRLCPHVPFRA